MILIKQIAVLINTCGLSISFFLFFKENTKKSPAFVMHCDIILSLEHAGVLVTSQCINVISIKLLVGSSFFNNC